VGIGKRRIGRPEIPWQLTLATLTLGELALQLTGLGNKTLSVTLTYFDALTTFQEQSSATKTPRQFLANIAAESSKHPE